MKTKDTKTLSPEDTNNKIAELRMELIKLNGQVATGSNPKNPSQIKNIKKNIARMLTALKAKK